MLGTGITRAAEFRVMLGTGSTRTGRGLYCATLAFNRVFVFPLHNKQGVLGINSYLDPPIKIINKSSEKVTAMLPDKLFKT